MRTVHDRLAEYGESHRDPTTELLHWISAPVPVPVLVLVLVLVLCVFGFLRY